MKQDNTPNFDKFISDVFHKSKPANKYLAAFSVVFGIAGMPLLGLIDANTVANKNNTDLLQGARDMTVGQKRNVMVASIISLIICFLLAYDLSDKDSERAAARYIIKRKLREISVQHPGLAGMSNTETVNQIADLLAANMNETDRKDIEKTARDFVKNMRSIEFHANYELETGAKEIAVKQIEDVINRVLARNPGLENIIVDIATGKTIYNPQLFAQKTPGKKR